MSDFFFFQAEDGIRDTSVTGVQTCALPIFNRWRTEMAITNRHREYERRAQAELLAAERRGEDRKSTRLNSSHRCISYAVFCLQKKNAHEHRAVIGFYHLRLKERILHAESYS